MANCSHGACGHTLINTGSRRENTRWEQRRGAVRPAGDGPSGGRPEPITS
ncbi:predicted protein [Streptomyces pristinaespiralis ATCC 25486]|uniref:Predicted protein n=1 Tax=Streptomyces pristinaespiralis (strain ATCC 25486 / DSM 40338 / CBS 914.69 / JCM 4507 / KCC S-0507 / NBRC 13074 / NRRL 2958 / 5647) TaxID=457429 RepID=D6X6W5_STRE2|nr:predicted protein [Streptomyces pristinaespiralis ATCC 25486]